MPVIMLVGGYDFRCEASSGALNARGYQVEQCPTLLDASRRLETLSPALVVLNTLVRDGDPYEFVRNLRKASSIPIIVRDLRCARPNGLAAFEAGADDYVDDSCSDEELALRIQAILGRLRSRREAHLKVTQK